MKRLVVARGLVVACGLVVASGATAMAAQSAVSCGGVAMLGAAQLNCSHVDATSPAQLCTFNWSLHSLSNGQKTVEGSFSIPPGAVNVMVYQGSGFDRALSQPIILCRGKPKS